MTHRRHCIAVDLGKTKDPSAIVDIEAPPGVTRYEATYLQRLPIGMDYTAVTDHIHAFCEKLYFLDPDVVIDAGGVGAPVVDALRARGVRNVISVVMTGGEGATKKAQVGDHEDWTVSRSFLLRGLASAVYSRRLRIAPMPEASQLLEELADLELRIMPSGAERVDVPNTTAIQHHADMTVACALALWRLSNPRPLIEFGDLDTLRR